MSTKKIQYNPNIVPIKNQTKKINKPIIINQNSLKNQLINRIKKHKQGEHNEDKVKMKENKINESNIKENKKDDVLFTDEFNDSINYLTKLSKKYKDDNKKNDMLNKTIKHGLQEPIVHVELELPDELKEVFPFNQTMPMQSAQSVQPPAQSVQPTYKVDTQVPYGCLKNGLKPTYKQFTRKQPILAQTVSEKERKQPILAQTGSSERERKLNILKQKYKEKTNIEEIIMSLPSSITNIPLPVQEPTFEPTIEPTTFEPTTFEPTTFEQTTIEPVIEPTTIAPVPIPISSKIIKKTIRKKYTLGKSNIYRKVSVLIKNNETRKKVITAQKELKKKSIHDIKKYLKEHFLLKSGSSAPNEVLRKMYESVMLSGDITNNNKETIVHNFMNE